MTRSLMLRYVCTLTHTLHTHTPLTHHTQQADKLRDDFGARVFAVGIGSNQIGASRSQVRGQLVD